MKLKSINRLSNTEVREESKRLLKRLDEIRSLEPSLLCPEIQEEVDQITNWLDQAEVRLTKPETGFGFEFMGPADIYSGAVQSQHRTSREAYELRSPQDSKKYRDLYGERAGYAWQDKSINFFQAVFSGRHHPELTTRSMIEGMPSDGGFLVPTEYSEQIHNVSLENELVMPRCFVQPMKTNEFHLPAMEIGDHGSNLFGGFAGSYVSETGTIDENSPKTRDMELNARKLTGLLRFSSELNEDIPGGFNRIIEICGKGLAWYRDKAFLKGTGAGQPLGILNAPCLLVQAKESGQGASTITYKNLTGMLSKLYPGSFRNSIWIAHQTTIPQLLSLTIAVGTGGAFIPVLTEDRGGTFKMLTRPVIFTEKTEPLGSRGDLILADLSQYIVGLRAELRFDLSIHKHFTTDEILARLIERHDGQPLWDKPLTLEDGSTQVSPFVVLAERT